MKAIITASEYGNCLRIIQDYLEKIDGNYNDMFPKRIMREIMDTLDIEESL